MKIFLFSFLLAFNMALIAMPLDSDISSNSQNGQLENGDEGLNASEDPLGEEDPLATQNDDPLATEAEDPLGGESVADTTPEEQEHYPKIKTKNFYRLAAGNKNVNREGFATGSASEKEDKAALVNAFQIKNKILYNNDVHALFRFNLTFLQEHDFIQDRYSDNGQLTVNEAYVKVDRGDFNYKVGALILKNGPLDIASPSNVLNMNNALAIESFDTQNLTLPIIGGQYVSVGKSSSFTLTASLLKPENAGTEYTRYLNESKQQESTDGTVEDYSEASDNFGMRYAHNFAHGNIGLSAYYWFDTDTEVSWTDTSNATIPNATGFSDTYSEKVTNVIFAGFDFDANLGKAVLKGEVYYFKDKNLYSFYKNSNNENVFSTTQADMLSTALSLERIYGDLFIMGVYAYKKAYDVNGSTNIVGFENLPDNNTEIRDMEIHQASLMSRYEINSKLKSLLSYTQAFPVKKVSALVSLDYTLNTHSNLGLKGIYIDTEKHLSTSGQLTSKQLFIEYKYKF